MRSGGEAMGRDERRLHAYHDGELGRWARWRLERRLARSPELRRELEALARLAELARRADGASPAPDLWDRIAGRLPALDAERRGARGPLGDRGPAAWMLRPALGLAAAAGLVVAVLVGLRDTAPTTPVARALGEPPGVVRWIDPGAKSVLVLEDDADATIIWVLEGGREVSRGEGREVVYAPAGPGRPA